MELSKEEIAEKFTQEYTTFDGKVLVPGRNISAKKINKRNYTVKPIKEKDYLLAVFDGDECIGNTYFVWRKYFAYHAKSFKKV